jgi:transcriptional regulator GlxA family with amidase domain
MGMVISGALDMLQTANAITRVLHPTEKPVFEYKIVSELGGPITTYNGYPQAVDGSWNSITSVDIVFIPGVGVIDETQLTKLLAENQSLITWLQCMSENNSLILSNCTGSLFLADAGLLDGKPATTAWPLSRYFATRYPEVELKPDALLTESGNFICSGSAMSYQELILYAIKRTLGGQLAKLCSRYLLVDGSRRSQASYRVLIQPEGKDPLIDKATSLIQKHAKVGISVADLARSLNVSSRTLIRKFKLITGINPLEYMQQHRIELAKELLETTDQSLDEIIWQVGYSDNSSFRRLFKRATGLTPNDYRKRFVVKDDL